MGWGEVWGDGGWSHIHQLQTPLKLVPKSHLEAVIVKKPEYPLTVSFVGTFMTMENGRITTLIC